MRTLISGINSGIGRYLFENLGGDGFDKNFSTLELSTINKEFFDVVIHCAFSPNQSITTDELYNYLNDNILLTNELVKIKTGKFVFFSTVDVYPKEVLKCYEEQVIQLDDVKSIYGITKLMSEALIISSCKDYLILRPTALLGKYSRPNSLIKILQDQQLSLSLSGDSSFNYVLYNDVYDFIIFCLRKNISGIFNIASNDNISLKEVSERFNKHVEFGSHCYNVGAISNKKVVKIFPQYNKSSLHVINEFLGEKR